MAISTDSRIRFFGTRDELSKSTGTSQVLSTNYSASGDQDAWTNDDDAEKAVIDLALTFGTNPTAGELVLLYMRKINYNGTNDSETPSDDVQGEYVGSVSVDNLTTAQYFAVEIDLVAVETSQQYEFYLKNDTGATLSASWTAHITPIAPGPHA